jgi:excisionase family DNA binding protein
MQPYFHTSTFPERALLVNNVARLTGIPKTTIRWNVRKGRLKAFKDPSRPKIWLIYRSDVEAFIARRGHVLSTN